MYLCLMAQSEHLDLQPLIPLLSKIEMNGNLTAIMEMFKGDAEYKRLFKEAFTDGKINSENMLKAMSHFWSW